MTGMPNVCAYSSAVRMRCALTTGRPSSLTATAPAPTISPNSASESPFCPAELAPIGCTRAAAPRLAEMAVHVDESRRDVRAGAVEDLCAVGPSEPAADRLDPPAAKEHVRH